MRTIHLTGDKFKVQCCNKAYLDLPPEDDFTRNVARVTCVEYYARELYKAQRAVAHPRCMVPQVNGDIKPLSSLFGGVPWDDLERWEKEHYINFAGKLFETGLMLQGTDA